ncbi:hypothetical protein [Aeoliella sp.]|uniref:hypothetical protein n=1 Tax=Aeoliella sp. TaxID=2795800 RepID=UPI003CCBD9DE
MSRRTIVAHHLIWTLYGHWLPNDPRGSGSEQMRDAKLDSLGPIHQGRKPKQLQPSRSELKQFQRSAGSLLTHHKFWISHKHRGKLAESVAATVDRRNYTAWALAILSNHMHMVLRAHRDNATEMWRQVADRARMDLREMADIADGHPVWSERPYAVFLYSEADVRSRIRYVERNPEKEGLEPQVYEFVKAYDGWPFRRK